MMRKTPFDIHRRDLNVQDVHFLEASAGTGKTYAIEHLAARLLLETPFSIDQILIVTFTRQATRELKARIRSTLIRTKEMLMEGVSQIDYLAHILEQGPDAVKEAIKKIDAALICFDTAQIFTIHGFCHRMLTECAFDCKIADVVASPDAVNPAFYYQKAVQDFLLYRIKPSEYSPQQLGIALKKWGGDPFRLIKKIVSLLSTESAFETYPTVQQLYEAFSTKLAVCPPVSASAMIEDFEQMSVCYKGMHKEEYQEQLEAWAQIVQDRTCSPEQFEALIGTQDCFLDKMQPSNLKVRARQPASLNCPGIFSQLRQELLPFVQEAASPMKILLRLSGDCRAHAREFLQSQECFSPDQMLVRLYEALDTPSFLEAVRNKYRAAIIDEFQDTDPLQWKIFQRLFLGHLDTLCLVGDPKQSIYAFRSADIYTYLDAARAVGEGKHKYLNTNFRSTPGLIDALNALFAAPKGDGWLALPKEKRSLPVEAVMAGSNEESASALLSRGAIHFFIAEAEKGRSAQWPTLGMEEGQLFPFIASEITRLRQKRDVPWEEIAVLIKDRFQAMRLVDYFKRWQIPASFRKGRDISQSDAVCAFKECLEAALSPSDLKLLKTALGNSLIRWDETLLRSSLDAPLLQRAKMHMKRLQKILYNEGFGPFFYAFLETAWTDDGFNVAENILRRGDTILYQDLQKLSQVLIEEEIARKLRASDFLRYLEEIDASPEEQRFETPPQESKGSVAVMTVHLSKGLEFDTVFALGLASRHAVKEDEAVRKDGGILIPFDEQHPACREALEELDAEKMRSLYVAMTRAKQQLYVPFALDISGIKQTPLKIGDASPLEIFFARLSKECGSSEELYKEMARLDRHRVEEILHPLMEAHSLTFDYVEPIAPPPAVLNTPSLPLQSPSLRVYIPQPHKLLSFSSLAVKTGETSDIPAAEKNTGLPLGATTGIVLHRIFERLFQCRLHHPLHEKKIEELIAFEVEGTPFAPFQNALFEMVLSQLHLCLLGETLRLRDIPADHLYQELEFLYPMAEHSWMKGFADLVFFFEGKYYLLDWKTNYLGPKREDYSRERMEQAMEAHQYYMQASLYASALKRYVKLFDNRPFAEIFGGAFYVFVRGSAVLHMEDLEG